MCDCIKARKVYTKEFPTPVLITATLHGSKMGGEEVFSFHCPVCRPHRICPMSLVKSDIGEDQILNCSCCGLDIKLEFSLEKAPDTKWGIILKEDGITKEDFLILVESVKDLWAECFDNASSDQEQCFFDKQSSELEDLIEKLK